MQLDFGFPRLDTPLREPGGLRPRRAASREQQFEFVGCDRLQQHTVFFALFVQPAAAVQIDEMRRMIAARSGHAAWFSDPARLHMSLVCLSRQSARPMTHEAEQAAIDAARLVRCAPFDLSLDHVTTFGPNAGGRGWEASDRAGVVGHVRHARPL